MAEHFEVIVIGGGPAGGTAALYTARAGLRTLVLYVPGRPGALASAQHIANFPGVPGTVSGQELVQRIREQGQSFGADYREDAVVGAALSMEPKMLFTNSGSEYTADGVIIATGALERRTKIPGEEEFMGHGVSICTTCDAAFYRDKAVVLTGNDDYAAEEGLTLADFASRVLFLVPAPTPSISPELLNAVQENSRIELRTGWRVREIVGNGVVQGVRVQTPDGEETVPTEGIFLYLGGAKPTTDFLNRQLAMDEDGAIVVDADGAASIERVYAVGDARAHHIRQAVIAAAEGCQAALALERALRGRKKIQVDYH